MSTTSTEHTPSSVVICPMALDSTVTPSMIKASDVFVSDAVRDVIDSGGISVLGIIGHTRLNTMEKLHILVRQEILGDALAPMLEKLLCDAVKTIADGGPVDPCWDAWAKDYLEYADERMIPASARLAYDKAAATASNCDVPSREHGRAIAATRIARCAKQFVIVAVNSNLPRVREVAARDVSYGVVAAMANVMMSWLCVPADHIWRVYYEAAKIDQLRRVYETLAASDAALDRTYR